jgi:hypothetical protein
MELLTSQRNEIVFLKKQILMLKKTWKWNHLKIMSGPCNHVKQ